MYRSQPWHRRPPVSAAAAPAASAAAVSLRRSSSLIRPIDRPYSALPILPSHLHPAESPQLSVPYAVPGQTTTQSCWTIPTTYLAHKTQSPSSNLSTFINHFARFLTPFGRSHEMEGRIIMYEMRNKCKLCIKTASKYPNVV